MKILIDECLPRKIKLSLVGSERDCQTVPEAGLAGKQNGELLDLAEERFDVFITLDKGIEYQQNLQGRKLSIILIRARSNRFADVAQHVSQCLEAMQSIRPGQLAVVGLKR
jgi:predicted nuclease of predicted toxin-antitoxin system